MMRRPDWTAPVQGIRLAGWGSHYNREHEACFVEVTYFHSKEAHTPALSLGLYDVLENKELASCASGFIDSTDNIARQAFCTVGEKGGDCGACEQFMKERMAN
jgi:hypothetical protein